MEILNRKDYCLSCEHILEEKGAIFAPTTTYIAEPTNLITKYCKHCGQKIEENIEQIKTDFNTFKTALSNRKLKVVAYVAPSVRAGIGEYFNITQDCQHKIVTALKMLGCYSVFSMNFGADLTITEESKELTERLKSNTNLPLLTSCCPAWINYVYKVYPQLKPNLSTCKSPQQMMGAIINNYYTQVNNYDASDIFVVSIVPCLAKKLERVRDGINSTSGHDVDACVTTVELASLIKQKGIDFINLPDTPFDSLFEKYSGSASAFGVAGGVSNAVIYNIDSSAKLVNQEFGDVVSKTFLVNGQEIHVAQVEGLANTKNIINNILNNNCKYHLVEVMACTGGCIGGAGQPKSTDLQPRKDILNISKNTSKIAQAKNNTIINNLYKTYLTPKLSKKLLHENRK